MTYEEAVKILGLRKIGPHTEATIKRRFREKAKKYHPDNGGDPEKFRQVHEAYKFFIKDDKEIPEPQIDPKVLVECCTCFKDLLSRQGEVLLLPGKRFPDDMVRAFEQRVSAIRAQVATLARTIQLRKNILGKMTDKNHFLCAVLRTEITELEGGIKNAYDQIELLQAAIVEIEKIRLIGDDSMIPQFSSGDMKRLSNDLFGGMDVSKIRY